MESRFRDGFRYIYVCVSARIDIVILFSTVFYVKLFKYFASLYINVGISLIKLKPLNLHKFQMISLV